MYLRCSTLFPDLFTNVFLKIDVLQEGVNQNNRMVKQLLARDASVIEVDDDILEDGPAQTRTAFDKLNERLGEDKALKKKMVIINLAFMIKKQSLLKVHNC